MIINDKIDLDEGIIVSDWNGLLKSLKDKLGLNQVYVDKVEDCIQNSKSKLELTKQLTTRNILSFLEVKDNVLPFVKQKGGF